MARCQPREKLQTRISLGSWCIVPQATSRHDIFGGEELGSVFGVVVVEVT